jgi:hypothetical protein
MAFDKPTRNRLASFVSGARNPIADEFTQQFQSIYGISEKGGITPLNQLGHLDDVGLTTATLLRERIEYLVRSHPEEKDGTRAAVDRLAREQAFTILNRLAALRMAEKRDLIVESVGKGYQSKGFKVFGQVAGSGLGDTYNRYRRYLFCLFDELAVDLGVLFDRSSPQGLLFPREPALLELLKLLNAPDLDALWTEDETIGWVYQYYNDPAERKKMRDESAAPRNSRELAARNQFFTPRYVVEFLTDNTLGRIWYEMTQGETRLKEQCRYLVRRPTEIFLKAGEAAADLPPQDGLTQEELLKQPIYIAHRPLEDPREIRMLDPACGSMHFGLYAFDLFEVIYDEAWEIVHNSDEARKSSASFAPFVSFVAKYSDKPAFLADVPRLIIEHNIHGIDIDPRCVQIAGLSLWLRAQKSWQSQKVPVTLRPHIRKSNIVCAEPMPGDQAMLREFVQNQFSGSEQPAFSLLLETIFEKMQLAGEAGSLLKIEAEIRSAVDQARKLWERRQTKPELFSTEEINRTLRPGAQHKLGGLEQAVSQVAKDFWETAEERIYTALSDYAEQAENGGGFQRRLFAEDASQGFAFIDVCRKQYDVALMNPPFGELASAANDYIAKNFELYSKNILCAFLERYSVSLANAGRCGSVLDRTVLIKNSYEPFRRNILLESGALTIVSDLGWGVLDANVEVSSVVLSKPSGREAMAIGYDVTNAMDKPGELLAQLNTPIELSHDSLGDQPFAAINFQMPIYLREALRKFPSIGANGVCFYNGHTIKSDVFKRLVWEVSPVALGVSVKWMWNGSEYSPFYVPFQECVIVSGYAGGLSDHRSTIFRNPARHGLPGLCFGKRGDFLDVQILPNGFSLTNEGFGGPAKNSSETWYILALLNSLPAQCALNFYCGQHKGVGYVNALPLPKSTNDHLAHVVGVTKNVYNICRFAARALETDPGFVCLTLVDAGDRKQTLEAWLTAYRSASEDVQRLVGEIDSAFLEVFDVNDTERKSLSESSKRRPVVSVIFGVRHEEEGATEIFWAKALLSHALGCAIGRWDIRYATGEKAAPELPDPFAPLPACPPGQLQNAEGLPAHPEDVPATYPIRIPWDGLFVDNPNHPLDIERCVREVIEIIWKDRAEGVEHEACKILGVKSLREYFRKPTGFFADHLKGYSKSRRQAPIYWPLSTASGSYTLWIYYHRLTENTLHTALVDFIDPKLKSVRDEIFYLRSNPNQRTRLEELQDLEQELQEFRKEIERIIKLPWKPNLNDGVLITASPLWKLFRLPKWQKDLRACWDELSDGDYDWAHLAYTIWPERVKEVCKTDRSVAIAHGLEALCEIQAAKPKTKRKKGSNARFEDLEA